VSNRPRKNILIISFYYPPNPAIGARRVSKITKELYKNGWNPYVITASYYGKGNQSKIEIPDKYVYHIDWFDFKNYRNSFRNKDVLGNLFAKILGFVPTRVFQNKFPDIDNYYWRKNAVKEAGKLIINQNIDLIYSSYKPISSVIIAKKLTKKYDIPWINEYRDLWTNNPYDNNSILIEKLNRYFEKRYISKAAALVTVSEPLKNDLIELHHKPTEVIYNGFDHLDQVESPQVEQDNFFRILYTGALYLGKRDPTPLFKALKILKRENYKYLDQLRVEFYGPNSIEILGLMIKKYTLQKIVFCYPSVNHNEVINKQRESNLLLLLGWNDKKDIGVVTGKLFEYMERQKKILAIAYPNSVIANILNETEIGEVIVDENKIIDFLKNEIELFFDKNKKFTSDIKLLEPYSRSNQVVKLINVFNKTVKDY
jgi:Glycosyltransferase Family 4